jgi:Transglycosylase SLT domain/SPOR domain
MALQSNPSVLTFVVSAIFLSAVMPAIAQDGTPPQKNNAMPEGEVFALPADETKPAPKHEVARDEATQETLCLVIESAAKTNGLPLEFFIRLIWQESRFQPKAVGPVTRNGQRAEGIAQFMPGTASERRLLDPFDPVQALPKSAEFLSELRNQFGNLGLAAAAYNAGPRRVQEWLAGSGGMPQETRNYVATVTGANVDDWALSKKSGTMLDPASNNSCPDLLVTLKRSPNPFVIQLEDRVRRAAVKLWGVQIAAGFNRDNALAMYAKAMKGLTALIGKQDDPLLIHGHGSSTFYQVQIGTNTRREADDLCNNMRRAGGACLVKRNKVEGPRLSRAKGHLARRVHSIGAVPPGRHDPRPL